MAWDVLLVLACLVILGHRFEIASCEEDKLKIPLRSGYLEGNIYFELMDPEVLSYTYRIRPAKNFGGVLNTTHYGIRLVPVSPSHGCSELDDSENNLYGAVALIERGGCSFLGKTIRAQESGAVGVIIMDHDYENDQRMIDMIGDETGRTADIPAFFLLGKDGHMIRKTLEHLHLESAHINIPINMTGAETHKVKHPPWSLW